MRATRKKRPADQNQWAKAHDAVITRRQPAREVSRPSQARQCFSSYAVGDASGQRRACVHFDPSVGGIVCGCATATCPHDEGVLSSAVEGGLGRPSKSLGLSMPLQQLVRWGFLGGAKQGQQPVLCVYSNTIVSGTIVQICRPWRGENRRTPLW